MFLLIVKEVQIKTMRYYFGVIQMVKRRKHKQYGSENA